MITILENSNIFDSDADAIVNPVNCVGVMGKGLAKIFKEKYPHNYQFYKWWSSEVGMKTGVCLFCMVSKNPLKYVINFPTKKHWKEKSKLSYIEEGLVSITNQIYVYNISGIKSIAFPALGCGLGGLEWKKVYRIIENHFSKSDLDIYVYPPK